MLCLTSHSIQSARLTLLRQFATNRTRIRRPGLPNPGLSINTSRASDVHKSSPTQVFNTNKKKTDTEDKKKRLLYPHVLSQRLKFTCAEGKLDEAVDALKNAPLDAQNTPVWNTMIWECLKAQRYALAYKLFTDMKRRGFSPTSRTFQTMFAGLSRIDHWKTHSKQLDNAHSLYGYFQKHLSEVKRHDPGSGELTVTPLASYIKILGDAGEYQRVFDVYHAMDTEGPLSPNVFVYTSILHVLAERRGSPDPEGLVQYQNATDAKLIWRQMLRTSQKSPGLIIDSHVVAVALKALSRGRQADKTFGLDILRDYTALDVSERTPRKHGRVALTAPVLDAALELLHGMEKYQDVPRLIEQAIKIPIPSGGASIIDSRHLERLMGAYEVMSTPSTPFSNDALDWLVWMLKQEVAGPHGGKIRPTLNTYKRTLLVCMASEDWERAALVYELMTGWKADEFREVWTKGTTYHQIQRSRGRNLVADTETMYYMLRTAVLTRKSEYERQCMRIIANQHPTAIFRPHSMKSADDSSLREGERPVSRKESRQDTFYQVGLAKLITQVHRRYSLDSDWKDTPDMEMWSQWSGHAKTAIGNASVRKHKGRPDMRHQNDLDIRTSYTPDVRLRPSHLSD